MSEEESLRGGGEKKLNRVDNRWNYAALQRIEWIADHDTSSWIIRCLTATKIGVASKTPPRVRIEFLTR
jgi:hypothetical protein